MSFPIDNAIKCDWVHPGENFIAIQQRRYSIGIAIAGVLYDQITCYAVWGNVK
jgi:hypothetical protein